MAPEVAEQREVLVARASRQGEVVDAGDGRAGHGGTRGGAIDGLRLADVGAAVAADGNGVVRGQTARHARAPQQLVADLTVDRLVDRGELLEAALHAGVHAGDELELRFAEIGGDVRMRERRPEPRRVRRRGERAVGPNAEALLLDAAPDPVQSPRPQRAKTFADGLHAAACGRIIGAMKALVVHSRCGCNPLARKALAG
jgi:hypothetical protein